MAISPPSDIVLDVARAAAPADLQAARQKLQLRATTSSAGSFDAAMAPASRSAVDTGARKQTPQTLVRFEAMVLQSFIQSMMPDDAEAVFGKGLAGDMWQSLLSEKLSEVMAERGGIGIADNLLKGYYLDGDKKVAVKGIQGPDHADTARQHLLADALLQETQRRFAGAVFSTEPAEGRNDNQ